MKRNLITLVLIVLVTSANAQRKSIGGHVGISTGTDVVVGIHAQWAFYDNFIAAGNITSHTNSVQPAMFQYRLGYSFNIGEKYNSTCEDGSTVNKIQIYIGRSYNLTTVDTNKGSSNTLVGGVMLRKLVAEQMVMYADINVNNRYSYITTGLAFVF